MRTARKLAPLAVVLVLAACSDDPSQLAPADPPTPEESAQGADHQDPNTSPISEAPPAEKPDSGVTPPPAKSGTPAPPPDAGHAQPPSPPSAPPLACTQTTGYSAGKPISICIATVDGKPVEVNTARAYLTMQADAKSKGVTLKIVSGFRTMAEQQYLYNCYLTKSCNNGNLAALPGYSNHQSGHALDLNTSDSGVYAYLTAHGSAFAFKRTVPSEIWHWEHW